ncbi:MAG: hypothetical protein JNL69_04270 [Bacteroidia bacterium]|nr:hypothetical protein [Bacteroidia bacterium]
MKNKKVLYLLLPAVVLLWGTIVYKITSGLSSTNENNTPQNIQTQTLSNENNIADTFSISLNHRDPFRDDQRHSSIQNASLPNNKTVKQESKPNPSIKTNNTSNIVYIGMIKNKNSNKELALIQIDGQSYTITNGEKISGFELKKIYRDSILVLIGKEQRVIYK